MNHCCKSCHFLIKESKLLPSQSWTKEDRDEQFPRTRTPPEEIEHHEELTSATYNMKIGCYKEVWSDDHNEFHDDNEVARSKIYDKITSERKNTCFFIEHQDGMSAESANELFYLRRENEHNNQTILNHNKRFRLALITSCSAIVLSAISLGWQMYATLFLASPTPTP